MTYAILLISPCRWLQAKTQQPIGVVSLVIIHVNGEMHMLTFTSFKKAHWLIESLSVLTVIFPGELGLASFIAAKEPKDDMDS